MESASAFIDEKIKELGDWRGKTLANLLQFGRWSLECQGLPWTLVEPECHRVQLVVSSRLSPEDALRLGLKPGLSLTRLDSLHRTALSWYRANCFR